MLNTPHIFKNNNINMAGKPQAKQKMKPRGNPLSDLFLKIGRTLSPTKRKEPELWEIWTSTLTANGIRPAERMTELIAWDVNNNGQSLGAQDMLKREGEVQKKFNEHAELSQMAQIAKDQLMQNVTSEVEHQKQMSEMNQSFLQNMNQTQNVMNDMMRQIQELKNSVKK